MILILFFFFSLNIVLSVSKKKKFLKQVKPTVCHYNSSGRLANLGILDPLLLTLNPAHNNSDEILNLEKNQSTHSYLLKYDRQFEHNLHSHFSLVISLDL